MTDNIAIRVSHLSKKYKLGGPQEQYHTLRDAMVNSLKAPFKEFYRAHPPDEGFWALKDVSFDVEQGEVVGIIGRNGAGKSTLLKIISRITTPTEGTVEMHGRVSSLLEVGTGFHPEMTGRENVFLNGSILGMKKTEIEQKFDEIVKFSEIEKFIDTPVKRYSSGMQVRLAFAVAAHLEPEILLVDEVLAVGDIGFQTKCIAKMGDVAKTGKTVLVVSHNMGSIHTLCNKCILLDLGQLIEYGQTNSVINQYISTTYKQFSDYEHPHNPEKPICLRKISLLNDEGISSNEFRYDEGFKICIEFEVNTAINNCAAWLAVRTAEGVIAFQTSDIDVDAFLLNERKPGYYQTSLKIPEKWLNGGMYSLIVGIAKLHSPAISCDRVDTIGFSILNIGTPEKIRTGSDRAGILQPFLKWETIKISSVLQ
jgi:lipopolysaccharide transport system ATP-binding protein